MRSSIFILLLTVSLAVGQTNTEVPPGYPTSPAGYPSKYAWMCTDLYPRPMCCVSNVNLDKAIQCEIRMTPKHVYSLHKLTPHS